jgi:hypothetical protein
MRPGLAWTARATPWSVAAVGAVAGLALGVVIAPGGGGGLAAYRSQNLWALVPSGWKDEDLVSQFGTARAGWFDISNPLDSLTVRGTAPAGAAPQARAVARARELGKSASGYVYRISWPGGRSAWEVLYTLHGVHTALFEFDGCSPRIAMTVTLNASSLSKLSDMEQALPQGAAPVCDGSAFSSPDRADVGVPLHPPSGS